MGDRSTVEHFDFLTLLKELAVFIIVYYARRQQNITLFAAVSTFLHFFILSL